MTPWASWLIFWAEGASAIKYFQWYSSLFMPWLVGSIILNRANCILNRDSIFSSLLPLLSVCCLSFPVTSYDQLPSFRQLSLHFLLPIPCSLICHRAFHACGSALSFCWAEASRGAFVVVAHCESFSNDLNNPNLSKFYLTLCTINCFRISSLPSGAISSYGFLSPYVTLPMCSTFFIPSLQ